MRYTSLILLAAFILGCSKDSSRDYLDVRVGMTYDEVEGVMGKPSSIGRGATELSESDRSVWYSSWEAVEASDRWPGQPPSWQTIDYIPGDVQTIGGLIYVRWDYPEIRTDTIFYRALRKEAVSTGSTNQTGYFLNEHLVPKSIYDIADPQVNDYLRVIVSRDYERTSTKYRIVTFMGEDHGPRSDGAEKIVSKRTGIMAVSNPPGIKVDSFFVPIQTESLLSVVFDASSGRVVSAGFFPISMNLGTPFRLPSIRKR